MEKPLASVCAYEFEYSTAMDLVLKLVVRFGTLGKPWAWE
jgi:hypothetical protein